MVACFAHGDCLRSRSISSRVHCAGSFSFQNSVEAEQSGMPAAIHRASRRVIIISIILVALSVGSAFRGCRRLSAGDHFGEKSNGFILSVACLSVCRFTDCVFYLPTHTLRQKHDEKYQEMTRFVRYGVHSQTYHGILDEGGIIELSADLFTYTFTGRKYRLSEVKL